MDFMYYEFLKYYLGEVASLDFVSEMEAALESVEDLMKAVSLY